MPNKLFVPMHLDAFVVSGTTLPKIKDIRIRYEDIKAMYGGLGYYVESATSEQTKTTQKGVHLHWTLPSVFRKGIHNQIENNLQFPLIPNRWLIIRFDKSNQTKVWILESDSDNSKNLPEKNWCDFNEKTQNISVKNIGKLSSFSSDWTEKGGQPFLTVMALGNPDFAAAYVHSKNILGFYDDLKEIEGNETFNYQVFGWFSDPQADPLFGAKTEADFNDKLAELDWILAENSKVSGNVPNGIVCHAMTHSLSWNGKDTNASYVIPSVNDIELGIGNSVSEAAAALLKKRISPNAKDTPQKLLAAFQYTYLENNGVQQTPKDALYKQINNRSFYPIEGGTHWVVEAKEKTEMGKVENDDDIISLDTETSNLLKLLNNDQKEYDELTDSLVSMQQELHSYKYLNIFIKTPHGLDGMGLQGKEEVTAFRANRIAEINMIVGTLKTKIKEVSDQLKNLKFTSPTNIKPFPEEYSGTIVEKYNVLNKALKGKYELKEVRNNPFYQSNNPTIAIKGLKPATRYLNKDKLLCRLENQIITQIIIKVNGRDTYLSSTDICDANLNSLINLVKTKLLNFSEIGNVIAESLFFMPSMYRKIATTLEGFSNATQNTLLPIVQQTLSNKSPEVFQGIIPLDFSVIQWQQPWIPLYMEWKASWESTDAQYSYSSQAKCNLLGRVLLSADIIHKVKELNKNIKDLTNNVLCDNFDFMAQELNGFTSLLTGRYKGIQLPLLNENELNADKDNEYIGNQYVWQPKPTEKAFFPFRNGTFNMQELRIIDAFGQVFNLITETSSDKVVWNNSAAFPILKNETKTTFSLNTRIMQPSRLNFEWISANYTDNRATNSDTNTSPICGWILLDKLDNSLAIFDSNGKELGDILETNKGIEFVSPLNLSSESAVNSILDLTLKEIVQNILGTNKSSFKALVLQIETINQKITPKNARQSLIMGIPIGFPIAIAKAKINLQLKGKPIKHYYWLKMTEAPTWTNEASFLLRIGDAKSNQDGLVGYFVNANYKTLQMPFGSNKETNNAAYLNYAEGINLGISKSVDLVLLLDARMSVNLNMDILPSTKVELPKSHVQKVLKNLSLSFLVAPIITPRTSIKIPLMPTKELEWKWLSNGEGGVEESIPDTNNNNLLTFEPLYAAEGWLKIDTKKTEESHN